MEPAPGTPFNWAISWVDARTGVVVATGAGYDPNLQR
jgi:hypothetical protein